MIDVLDKSDIRRLGEERKELKTEGWERRNVTRGSKATVFVRECMIGVKRAGFEMTASAKVGLESRVLSKDGSERM